MYVQTGEGLGYFSTVWSPRALPSLAGGDDNLFTRHRRGYSRYGGGRVDERLRQLRENGKVNVSDAEIDMLQRIANVESSGLVQGINSYDSAFMSMGFMQWPVAYGKLQELIRQAPVAFQRYGIELDTPRLYTIRTKYGTETPIAIKGAPRPDDLRSLDWAKRFYDAGLDADVIIAEVRMAPQVIEESKKRIKKRVGSGFLPYYENSPVLRALIQETFNNRPGYLYSALKRAMRRANAAGAVGVDQFLELVRGAIREVYTAKESKDGPKKAKNLIYKTARLVL